MYIYIYTHIYIQVYIYIYIYTIYFKGPSGWHQYKMAHWRPPTSPSRSLLELALRDNADPLTSADGFRGDMWGLCREFLQQRNSGWWFQPTPLKNI